MNAAKRSLHWKLTSIANVVGIDHSKEVIAEYQRQEIFSNIIYGDAQQLEKSGLSGVFDVIVLADIIEHLSNPGMMLDGIKPFCNRETRVIITTPHAFGLPNYTRFLRRKFRDSPEHVLTFNQDNIQNLLHRHGYDMQSLDTCYQSFARQHGILFSLGRVFFERIPNLGGTLFIVTTLAQDSSCSV